MNFQFFQTKTKVWNQCLAGGVTNPCNVSVFCFIILLSSQGSGSTAEVSLQCSTFKFIQITCRQALFSLFSRHWLKKNKCPHISSFCNNAHSAIFYHFCGNVFYFYLCSSFSSLVADGSTVTFNSGVISGPGWQLGTAR